MKRYSLSIALSLMMASSALRAVAAKPAPTSDWPVTRKSLPRVVAVVPVSDTKTRYTCHVRAIASDTLTCRIKHGSDTVYRRDDIAALLDPYHVNMKTAYVLWTVSAACLAASFFVPILPSVILRVYAGSSFFGGGLEEDSETRLLYWRPGTAVDLP